MAESNREEIAKLEALYANNPGGRVFTHLAEAYRKAGELDRARAILESGITRHPDYASAHVVLGRVLIDQGSLENAATEFRRVLELDPENRVALRSLGDIARSSDPENALEHYRHLRSLDPADDDLANTIANLESQLAAEPVQESFEEPEPSEVETLAPPPEETAPDGAEPVQSVFAEPVSEPEAAPYEPPIQPSEADFGAGWEPESEEEGLPGDLAHLARLESSDSSEVVEEPTAEISNEAPPIEADLPADEPWAAAPEPAALDEPWSSEPIETVEPWAQPEPTENDEPWATSESTDSVDPWGTSEADSVDPWATPEPTEPAEPWASPEPIEPAEPWAASSEPIEPAEPWASPEPIEPAAPWAASSEPWTVTPEPEVAEPWAAPADAASEEEPWATPADAPEEESVEATLEVVGFVSARTEGDEVESTETPADATVEDHSAPLPEFSGFAEAADAILRPEGDTQFEVADRSVTAEPSFEEMLSANLGTESPLVREDSEDLPTETLAELYRTQGFFGRAAEVYRALLAESPDDARLRGLLREVEELEHSPMEAAGERFLELDAVAAADDELSARVAASAEDSGPPEAWLEGVESAWTGGSGAADIDDAHYPWSHDAKEESEGGVSLQDYLKTLLAWRPTESAVSAPVDAPERAEPEEEVSESFAYTVSGDTARTEISPPPEPAEPATTENSASAGSEEQVPDPWEETPSSPAPTAVSPPEPPEPTRVEFARPAASTGASRSTGNAVDDAFEEWFSGSMPSTPSAPAQPAAPARAAGTAPPPPVPAQTPAADLEDEADDDLEVFRSWLQSLKR